MPPEGQGFYQYTAGPSGWGQGDFLRRNAFDLSGIPGFQGQQGMLAGMMLQSFLPSILGPNFISAQMMPTGQNLQMHYQVMDYYRQRQQALQLASSQDEEHYFRTIRGVSNMTGTPFGAPQQQAARRVAHDFAMIDPFIAQSAPEWWDRMHGMRGSATVMAMGMQQAGRMGFDPITGRMGFSGQSTGEMTRRIYDRLYAGNDTDRIMRDMSGLRMGQAGMMLDEMMQRGLGPAQMDRDQAIQLMRGRGVRTDQMGQPQLDAAVRGFQADRTASQMKEYSGAVKAVQEIFGDMGHPDAPMSQIFNALQALTQGGAGRFSPAELERSVRQTYAVAKMTRMGIDAMSGLMGELSQTAEQRGLDRSFAVPAATEAAILGHVYGTSGALGAGGWGRLSKEQYTQLAGRLTIQAAASDQATQLGAIAMIGERIGFRGRGAAEAEALAKAVKEGRDTYTFNDPRSGQAVTRSVFMAPQAYSNIMQAGGVDQSVIDELRHSPHAVQEYIHRYNIGGLVRVAQGRLDIDPKLNSLFQGVAFDTLQQAGMGQRDADQLSQEMGVASTRALRSMTQAERADPKKRDEAFVRSIRQQLGNRVQRLSDQQIRQLSVLGWARTEQYIHTAGSELAGYEGVQGLLDETDPEMARRAQRVQREVGGIAEMQHAVRGLGQAGFLSRITEAISNAPANQPFEDVVAQALGGVRRGTVTARVTANVQRLQQLGTQMQGAAAEGNQQQIDELRRQAEIIVGQLNTDFEQAPNLPRQPGAPPPPAGAPGAPPAAGRAGTPAAAGGAAGGGGSLPSLFQRPLRALFGEDREEGERDASPHGRGRMEIAGVLKIEWPNIARLFGHGTDPRSART